MILKYSLPVFCFLLAGYSCTSGHKEKRTSTATETTCTDPMYTVLIHADSIHATLLQKNKVGNQPTSGHEKSPMALYMDSLGLVNIAELDSSIAISLMYTQADNFTGEILYDSLAEAYLHVDAAHALMKAQKTLKELYPSYSLIIYDAARPMSVQRKMWDVVKGTSKYRYISNPNHQYSGFFGPPVIHGHKSRSSWCRSTYHRGRRTGTKRQNYRSGTSEPNITKESDENSRIPCIAQRMVAFQFL